MVRFAFSSNSKQFRIIIFELNYTAPVFIVNIQRNMMNDALLQTHTFNNIHKFNSLPAACTALSVCENDIASVGEDGTLNVLSAEGRIIKQFPNVDSCSMTAVAFINHKEVRSNQTCSKTVILLINEHL